MRLPIACLLGLLSTPLCAAEIHRYLDDQGRTVFTDRPPEGRATERVTPGPLNLVPPPPSANEQADAGAAVKPITGRYARLEIINLPDDEALRDNNGTFEVQVALEPPLAPEHSLRLLVDGLPHGATSRGPSLLVRQLDRGTHSLVVQVLDALGQPIQQSDAVTFTLQRISLNSPARPPAP